MCGSSPQSALSAEAVFDHSCALRLARAALRRSGSRCGSTKPTSLSGVEIPAETVVASMLFSANRDSDVYESPEVFDIFRSPGQHLSFGTGPHLCLGMHLARMETRVALNELFDRLPNLRLDQDEAQRVDPHIHGDLLFRSPTALPVVWDRV